jgi:CheY-like chemotaxis protein
MMRVVTLGLPHRTRLLLVDDSPEFLHAIRSWLAGEGAVRVVGEAHSGDAAVAAVCRGVPHVDVVLMDAVMPGLDGFQATQQIKALGPAAPRVVIVSFTDEAAAGVRARQCGADAFLAKSDLAEGLMPVLLRLRAAPGWQGPGEAGDAQGANG